jgi:PAS domain S-box-containing protein
MSDNTVHKQAEELRIQNEIFSQVLDGMDALVYVTDMKTDEIIFINSYGQNIWGDIKGKICWQTIQSGQDGHCSFCSNSKIIGPDGNPTEGVIWEFRNTVNKKWYDCRDRAIHWPDGRIVRLEIAMDITRRKEAEEALRSSEELYRSFFRNNHAVMLLIDPDKTTIEDANPAACDYYGWSHKELVKRRIDEINTLNEEEVAAEIRLARSEKRNHFFFKHRLANGKIRDVEVYSGPISMKGRILLYSIIHDITERRHAEEALAAERHQLAEINTALRVLLHNREEDQKEMEEKICTNIHKLVLPPMEKLRNLNLNNAQAECLDMVAANLQQITSPFLKNLAACFASFTRREIQVANMIKEGRTSKEIANTFNMSTRSVEFHRDNIRRKLGLNRKKSSLYTFLLNLSEK